MNSVVICEKQRYKDKLKAIPDLNLLIIVTEALLPLMSTAGILSTEKRLVKFTVRSENRWCLCQRTSQPPTFTFFQFACHDISAVKLRYYSS